MNFNAVIDLRSDTVTQPTGEMREAMASAVVGDDAYGEDPTVAALEERYAALVGKERAIFLPSGIMANQVGLRTLTHPGEVVVAGARQHLVHFERGASARNALVQFHTLDDASGELDLDEIASTVELYASVGHPVRVVAIENTHMSSGGTPWRAESLRRLGSVVGEASIYLDGARLFNASVSTGVSPAELAAPATLVMSCVSKGLGAPMGSLLAGSAELIGRARAERIVLGGRLRQAGIVAAAGLIALSNDTIASLADDHTRAAQLAYGLAEAFGEVALRPEKVRTNIVIMRTESAQEVVASFASHGVLINRIAPQAVRFMTHRGIGDEDIERTCLVAKLVAQER
ncbi:MAG: threonine aldolase family protein [Ferrimicrobium sp.]